MGDRAHTAGRGARGIAPRQSTFLREAAVETRSLSEGRRETLGRPGAQRTMTRWQMGGHPRVQPSVRRSGDRRGKCRMSPGGQGECCAHQPRRRRQRLKSNVYRNDISGDDRIQGRARHQDIGLRTSNGDTFKDKRTGCPANWTEERTRYL